MKKIKRFVALATMVSVMSTGISGVRALGIVTDNVSPSVAWTESDISMLKKPNTTCCVGGTIDDVLKLFDGDIWVHRVAIENNPTTCFVVTPNGDIHDFTEHYLYTLIRVNPNAEFPALDSDEGVHFTESDKDNGVYKLFITDKEKERIYEQLKNCDEVISIDEARVVVKGYEYIQSFLTTSEKDEKELLEELQTEFTSFDMSGENAINKTVLSDGTIRYSVKIAIKKDEENRSWNACDDFRKLESMPSKYQIISGGPLTSPQLDENVAGLKNVYTANLSADTNYGDIDQDGKVDISDLSLLSLYLIEETELSDAQLSPSDVTGDGTVNLSDLSRLKQFVSGKDITLGTK